MLSYILWAVCAALDLSVLLTKPRLRVFRSYLAWKMFLHASNLAALLISPKAYFYTYWLTTFINTLFGMAVVAEAFSLTTRRFHRALFWLLILAAVISYFAPLQATNSIAFTVYSTQRVLFLVAAGLVAYSMTFKPLFGADRFAIAFGFGVFSSASLLRSALGYQARHLPTVAYIAAGIIWLVYLRKRNKREIAIPRKSVVSVRKDFRQQRTAVNSYMQSTISCD
jgi:hypothetical protein